MSLCIVESYNGWMDRSHDVMTVISGAPLILVTKGGGMDLKRVHFHNDSQRYVNFGSLWPSEMVRCDVIGNVETF